MTASEASAGLERGADGWTVVTASQDSRIVYVSSSAGNNSNDGLSPDSPVRTIAQAKLLMRDKMPDQMLLKRGDTWVNESFGDWTLRGRSQSEPMVLGAYGQGARPLIQTGSKNGVPLDGFSAVKKGTSFRDITIQGLHFQGSANTGAGMPYGIRFDSPGENLLIEDTKVEGFKDNLVFQSNNPDWRYENLQIRRSVIVDSFARATFDSVIHSQGLFISHADGIVIEENVFDHNGWLDGSTTSIPTMNNHNIYIQSDTSGLVVRGNVIANASSDGLQARNGGIVEENLFVNNSIAFFIAGELTGQALNNVVLHGSDRGLFPDGAPRAWGIDMSNKVGSAAIGNIIAHSENGVNALTGMWNVADVDNIIYKWGTQTSVGPYVDPERTMATYDAMIRGLSAGTDGSLAAFLAQARLLSRANWDEAYMAHDAISYFREGFNLAHLPEPQALSVLVLGGLALRRRRRQD